MAASYGLGRSAERSPRGLTRKSFEELRRRVQGCFACLQMQHVHILGDTNGPLDAPIMFVAEAPGRFGAARSGVPMTSDVTGRRFQAFLALAGIRRRRAFITNAILCNPLDGRGRNRSPRAAEVTACNSFLAGQIALVDPELIVSLGGVALNALRRIEPHDYGLAQDVGRALPWVGRTLVPLYHPSQQSTMSRPHDEQIEDWRRLGRIAQRALGPRPFD